MSNPEYVIVEKESNRYVGINPSFTTSSLTAAHIWLYKTSAEEYRQAMDKEKIWEIKSIGIVEPVKPKAEYWVALNVTVEHPQGYAAVCTDEGCVAYFEDSDHAHYFAKWLEGGSRW